MYSPRCLRWSTVFRSRLICFFLILFWSYPSDFSISPSPPPVQYCKYCVYFISKCSYYGYLSAGVSFRQLSFPMRISKSAIAPIIKETTCAIWTSLQAQHTPSPTEEIFQEIAKDFNIRWNISNFVWSIDGKHIRIKCPPNSGSQYCNYRQYHSTVVDANRKFVTKRWWSFPIFSSVSELGNTNFEIAWRYSFAT